MILDRLMRLFNAKPRCNVPRSPLWPEVRKKWLAYHGSCAVCGRKTKLQVHHIIPFHVDPSKELDTTNLITLCEGNSDINCHYVFGHFMDWMASNPTVREDAFKYLFSKAHAVPYKVIFNG